MPTGNVVDSMPFQTQLETFVVTDPIVTDSWHNR